MSKSRSTLAKEAIQTTLYYQIAWRDQNNGINLSLPGECNALSINVDATKGYQCTHIARQISKEELVKVI